MDVDTARINYAVRKTARAIMLTPSSEVLLIRMAFPWNESDLWILPGGGIEKGESAEDAVVREVFEETGATDINLIGEAWHSESFIDATNTVLKQRIYLVQAELFDPEPASLSEEEIHWIQEYRWWSMDSLLSANIAVEPINIGEGLRAIILQGLPSRPIDIDTIRKHA